MLILGTDSKVHLKIREKNILEQKSAFCNSAISSEELSENVVVMAVKKGTSFIFWLQIVSHIPEEIDKIPRKCLFCYGVMLEQV